MIVVAHFSAFGVPTTGLTPIAKITSVTGTTSAVVIAAAPMMEIGDGFYQYNFATHVQTNSYVVIVDGGAALGLADRYQVANIESTETSDPDLVTIRKMLANRSRVNPGTNTLIVYEDDKTTPFRTYDLKDFAGVGTSTNVFDRNPV